MVIYLTIPNYENDSVMHGMKQECVVVRLEPGQLMVGV